MNTEIDEYYPGEGDIPKHPVCKNEKLMCLKESPEVYPQPSYICTRYKHKHGVHEACGPDNMVLRRWKVKE